jgi:predicted RNA binding protein YcfA (HicA-like mRNA interferase family)
VTDGIDWRREQAGAGSQNQSSLASLALRAGWYEVRGRGRGSHRYFKKDGVLRPVVIPARPAVNTVRAIINQLGGGDV